jgi:hypothetical protein
MLLISLIKIDDNGKLIAFCALKVPLRAFIGTDPDNALGRSLESCSTRGWSGVMVNAPDCIYRFVAA